MTKLTRRRANALLAGTLAAALPTQVFAADKKVKLIVAAYSAVNTPWDLNWQDMQAVFENNEHDFDVTWLIRGETGSTEERVLSLRRNRVQFVSASLGAAATVVPELAVLQMPFLFESAEELDFVMDNYMFEPFENLFDQKSLLLLRWTDSGWNNIYAKKALYTPEDIKNYPMRAQSTKASIEFLQALDSEVAFVASPDLLPSLQTGLIEGGEGVSIFYSMIGLAKEAPHLTMTRHSYETGAILVNRKWFDGLTADQQDFITNSYPSIQDVRTRVRTAIKEIEAGFPERGVEVHELNDEQRAAWKQAGLTSHKAIVKSAGGRSQEIYELALEGKREFAAQMN